MRRYKALLIGISYHKPNPAPLDGWEVLDGPLRDVQRMASFVRDKLRYENVVTITDETNPMEVSRRNILAKLSWLVEDANDGDILFLHYAGHGWQRPTRKRTEEDGLDETIVPADCPCPAKRPSIDDTIPQCHFSCSCLPGDPLCWQPAYRGMIRDNDMRDVLVERLGKGVRLVTIFDCCHSGSILDLQYQYLPRGAAPPMVTAKGLTPIPPELRNTAKPRSTTERIWDFIHPKSHPCIPNETLGKFAEMAIGHGMPSASIRMVEDHMHVQRNGSERGVVISLSGCVDHNVVFELGDSHGTLTTFFLRLMEKHKYKIRTDVLLDEMYPLVHSEWKKYWSKDLKYPPYPVLCSNQLVDLSAIFIV